MLSRPRLIGALIAIVAALLLTQYVRVWLAIPPDLARTSDFAGTYAAATLWRTGHGDLMYSSPAEERVLRATGTPADHLDVPFENPPSAAVVASPLSLLDPVTAYRVWSLLQLGLIALAVLIAARAAPWPARAGPVVRLAACLAAIAGVGTFLLFAEGQWDGPVALGVAFAYASWRRGHGGRAGFAIGFTMALAKPHLALGLVAFATGRRDRRALAGIATGAATAVLLSVLGGGFGATSAFVHALLTPSYNPLTQMQGASGLVASWLGQGGLALAAIVACMAGGILVAGRLGSWSRGRADLLEPAFAGAVAMTLFVAPHLLAHDLVLLAPVLVFGLAWVARRAPAPAWGWPDYRGLAVLGAWVLLSLTALQDLGNSSPAPPGRVTPWVLLLLGGLCWTAVAGARQGALTRLAASPSRHNQVTTTPPNSA